MSAAIISPLSTKIKSVFAPTHQTVANIVPPITLHKPEISPAVSPTPRIEPPKWMKPVEEEIPLAPPVLASEEKKQEESAESFPSQEPSLELQMIQSLPQEDLIVKEDFPVVTELPSLEAIAPAMPLAVTAAADTLNPQNGLSPSTKESSPLGFTIEKPGIDQVPGIQYVESEPQHELNPELEAYISKVENHQNQLPSEVVITNPAGIQPTTHYAAKPVIVLPITPELEKTGSHKATSFSIRWLVEWSRKVMKMFHGQAAYKETV